MAFVSFSRAFGSRRQEARASTKPSSLCSSALADDSAKKPGQAVVADARVPSAWLNSGSDKLTVAGPTAHAELAFAASADCTPASASRSATCADPTYFHAASDADDRARRQNGGTIRPRRRASAIRPPAAARQTTTAATDASGPNAPPVNSSLPENLAEK